MWEEVRKMILPKWRKNELKETAGVAKLSNNKTRNVFISGNMGERLHRCDAALAELFSTKNLPKALLSLLTGHFIEQLDCALF